MARGRKTGGLVAKPMRQKILDNCIPEPNSGCWLWTGRETKLGYAFVAVTGTYKLAHRESYRCFKGDFDPALDVCHSCDNPICVNPDHLWLGTHTDNMRDMARKGRSGVMRGTANPLAKIDDALAVEIWNARGGTRTIAARYGLTRTLVRNIKVGKTWRHVTGASA